MNKLIKRLSILSAPNSYAHVFITRLMKLIIHQFFKEEEINLVYVAKKKTVLCLNNYSFDPQHY